MQPLDFLVELQTFLNEYKGVLYAFAFAIGATVASFVNVVAYRLPLMAKGEGPEGMTLSVPTSHCPKCKTKIKKAYLAPVLGWFATKGACASCKLPIAKRYPLVEFIGGAIFVGLAYSLGPTLHMLFAAVASSFLLSAILIGIDDEAIPDNISLGLLWLTLAYSLTNSFNPDAPSPADAILGATVGYLMFFTMSKAGLGSETADIDRDNLKMIAAIGALSGVVGAMLSLIVALAAAFAMDTITSGESSKRDKYGELVSLGGVVAVFASSFQLIG